MLQLILGGYCRSTNLSQERTPTLPLGFRIDQRHQILKASAVSEWVFAAPDAKRPLSRSTVGHAHARVRTALGLPRDFVVHSWRHTMLTRLGEAGVDVFTIMRIAGHCSVVVSQRYVHPTPETLERAFDQMDAAAITEQERRLPETVPTEVPTETRVEERVVQ